MDEAIDLLGFIQAVMDRSFGWFKSACDGLTEEQLRYQPAAESNSIAWLVWHSSRVKDQVTANISGEGEVWVTEGWAAQFGMDPDATGVGDSPERVAADLEGSGLLFGYADSAHRATVQRFSKVTPAQLGQPVQYVLGDTRPAWQAIRGMLGDSYSHAGQVAYLRGMITGSGWYPS